MKSIFGKLSILIITVVFGSLMMMACMSNRNSSAEQTSPKSSDSSASSETGKADSSNSTNQEANSAEKETLDAEKEKLQKERARLEKEKQNLKDEKTKMEKMKNASPPSSRLTDTMMTLTPPTNIRDSPNGKVLCVVKEQGTFVKIYGSTDISDENGEWFYTNHCGKMGVIHSSQVVSPS